VPPLPRGKPSTREQHSRVLPRATADSPNLVGSWFLVNAPLAAGLPAEVFDHVGQVRGATIDTRPIKCIVQKPAGWSYKWTPLDVFAVPGLLTDEEQSRLS
jgi:hypothetical protein